MTVYIGVPGQLIRLKCPSNEQVEYASRSSYRTTMGGRVVEQRGPRPRRVWSLDTSAARPEDVASLDALYLSSSAQAYAWVSPDAMSVNALTPAESLLDSSVLNASAVPGPPRVAVDGVNLLSTVTVPAGRLTYVSERRGVSDVGRGVPVVPGETYTVTSYGAGAGGRLRLLFRDGSGAFVANPGVSFGAELERRSVTWVAPAGATNLLLEFSAPTDSPLVLGAPQVTWTQDARPWAVGRGCHSASVESLAFQPTHTVRTFPGLNFQSNSYTIREVG